MPATSLNITYIGGPTALLEFGGMRLLTDPTFDPAGGEYQTGPVTLTKLTGPVIAADRLGRIDAILLSHDQHSDNLDRAGRDFLGRAEKVLTTPTAAERLHGGAIGLRPWEVIDLASPDGRVLQVTATPARHGPAGMERGPVTGFVAAFTDAPGEAMYVSGDTVWYEGVAEVAARFPIQTAILFMGAARVPAVGPWHLTMTAREGAIAARAFANARIVPLHFEGWAHFSESREDIARAFAADGLADRLWWPDAG